MLNYLSKSVVFGLFMLMISSFGSYAPNTKEFKGELISHVQVKKHPSNDNFTLVRFALHYDARVTVFLQKRGSSALIQYKKTAQLNKGVKTVKIDQIQYPSSKYQMVIKAGKTSKTVDYSL